MNHQHKFSFADVLKGNRSDVNQEKKNNKVDGSAEMVEIGTSAEPEVIKVNILPSKAVKQTVNSGDTIKLDKKIWKLKDKTKTQNDEETRSYQATEVEKNQPICVFYKKNSCRYGDLCWNKHDTHDKVKEERKSNICDALNIDSTNNQTKQNDKSTELEAKKPSCFYFKRACCPYGDICWFSHDNPLKKNDNIELASDKMEKNKISKVFEPLKQPCKFHLVGICRYSDKCRDLHTGKNPDAGCRDAENPHTGRKITKDPDLLNKAESYWDYSSRNDVAAFSLTDPIIGNGLKIELLRCNTVPTEEFKVDKQSSNNKENSRKSKKNPFACILSTENTTEEDTTKPIKEYVFWPDPVSLPVFPAKKDPEVQKEILKDQPVNTKINTRDKNWIAVDSQPSNNKEHSRKSKKNPFACTLSTENTTEEDTTKPIKEYVSWPDPVSLPVLPAKKDPEVQKEILKDQPVNTKINTRDKKWIAVDSQPSNNKEHSRKSKKNPFACILSTENTTEEDTSEQLKEYISVPDPLALPVLPAKKDPEVQKEILKEQPVNTKIKKSNETWITVGRKKKVTFNTLKKVHNSNHNKHSKNSIRRSIQPPNRFSKLKHIFRKVDY
ncbi:uncharacterized protein LOC136032911 [Artemia franciscana]|uniref:Nucleoporin NUP42 n=1 Tax=Artemia franciscana TaxID=6661 RepID=A0AA88LJK7_ARTSF|nr:hypothetical protein QYM36_000951 [Artemia franciscana]